jgi:hypothetical protein
LQLEYVGHVLLENVGSVERWVRHRKAALDAQSVRAALPKAFITKRHLTTRTTLRALRD